MRKKRLSRRDEFFERRAHVVGNACSLSCRSIDIDVDEISLCGGLFIVITEQSDFISHTAVAKFFNAQSRVYDIGELYGRKVTAFCFDNQPDDVAGLDL